MTFFPLIRMSTIDLRGSAVEIHLRIHIYRATYECVFRSSPLPSTPGRGPEQLATVAEHHRLSDIALRRSRSKKAIKWPIDPKSDFKSWVA
jgi:hypothetical protein